MSQSSSSLAARVFLRPLFVLLALLSVWIGGVQEARALTVKSELDLYSSTLGGLTDAIDAGGTVRLQWVLRYDKVPQSGMAKLTLPPMMTYVSGQSRFGSPVSLSHAGGTITATLLPGGNEGRSEIWLTVQVASLADLPEVAPDFQVKVSANAARAGESASGNFSHPFAMLYSKVKVTADTSGPVAPGDLITYTVQVPDYPHFTMYSSRLTLTAPNDTDMVASSLAGNSGGTVTTSGTSRFTIDWGTQAPRSHTVSFQVRVRPRNQISPSVTEINCNNVSFRLQVETPYTGNPTSGAGGKHRRTISPVAPAVKVPFDTSLELGLGFDRLGVAVNQEFQLKARITNMTPFQVTDAKLDLATLAYSGEGLAEPTGTPPAGVALAPGASAELIYRFRATRNGKLAITVLASGQAMTYQNFKISTPLVTSGRICVGCSGVGLEIELPEDADPAVDMPFMATVVATSYEATPQLVTFTPSLLTEAGSGRFKIEAGEVPAFTLTAANPIRSFPVVITPLKPGTGTVRSDAEVLAANGGVSTTGVSKEIVVSPLSITLRAKPLLGDVPIVNMKLSEEPDPQTGLYKVMDADDHVIEPKIEVIIENKSDQPVAAQVESVSALARDRSALVGARIAIGGQQAFDAGTLAPGAIVRKEYPLLVKADGRFHFRAMVNGRSAGAAEPFRTFGTGAPIAVGMPYPVELELDFARTPAITNQNNGAFFMQPGASLQIFGKVTNKTSNSTVEFHGIRSTKNLNALSAVLTSDDGNMVDPPFPHQHEIEANGVLLLSGKIMTEADGAPSGTATFEGMTDIVLIDDGTGDETKLTMDDVLVTGGLGGWLGNPLSVRIIQDHSRPFAPAALTNMEEVAYWSHGAMVGMGQWWYDNLDSIGAFGRVPGSIAGNPSQLGEMMGSASRAVWEGAEYLAFTWKGMTPAQREAFVQSAALEVARRAYLMKALSLPFDPSDFNQVLDYTRNSTYSLFSGMEAAYASDDPAQIADLWGRVSGNAGMEVITMALPSPKLNQYAKAQELSNLVENSSISKVLNDQETLLRTLKPGKVDADITLRAWGLTGDYLKDIQEIFRRFGIKGYMRERTPESHTLIDVLGEAVWKPEAMKPKGISDVDMLLLGDDMPTIRGKSPENRALDPVGITAIFMPDPDDVIRANLAAKGHSEAVIEVALRRAASRRKEFDKHYPNFKQWSKPVSSGGGLPMKKNYKDNGVPNPGSEKGPNRPFRYDVIERPGKPPVLIPKMMNSDLTEFKFISGDIDWIHFTFLDGTPIDPVTAARLYDTMSRWVGLQHPETISWIDDLGQSIFVDKADQLVDYLRGEKALLEVSGTTTNAVHISMGLSRFARKGRTHLIHFDGGMKSRVRAAQADIEDAFAYFQAKWPDRRIFMPFLWNHDGEEPDGTIGGNPNWNYSTNESGGSPLLVRGGDGENVEVFNGTTWVPRPVSSLPPVIKLAPTSAFSSETAAGAISAVPQDPLAIWPDQMGGRIQQWFAPGQVVVIEPGTIYQEVRRIVSVNPLVFDSPLDLPHAEDAMISYLSPTLYAAVDPVDRPVALGITPYGTTGELIADFMVPYGGSAILEESGTLAGSWSAIPLPMIRGGQVQAGRVSVTYPGEVISVVLPTRAPAPQRRFVRAREP
ncbi:hypothetical protein OKA04_12520 [Luteolibacter flavescens]|uniref:Uncharacterized protein n=1 Tax=Luteolibacter flavescens TaxID=1859460 RepID=A0ABT3FPQ5_9BACT|nr:hypothetical protein [Luteolibacter flavescens]MCW1885555.1 hypothetical protein [Luteolibacter flavescens]